MNERQITLTRKQEQVVGYAICFLLSNMDSEMEGDLQLTEEEIRKLMLDTTLVKKE